MWCNWDGLCEAEYLFYYEIHVNTAIFAIGLKIGSSPVLYTIEWSMIIAR